MSPPKWDERLMEDIAVAAEYDAASEILDRAKRLANALRVVLDERDALRADLGEAERLLHLIDTRLLHSSKIVTGYTEHKALCPARNKDVRCLCGLAELIIKADDFNLDTEAEAVELMQRLSRLRALGGREGSDG